MVDQDRPDSPQDALDSPNVAKNCPCNHCGYNLRGLNREGRCPECGSAIVLSLRGDLLSAADPTWLARVENGHQRVGAGFLLLVVGVVVVPTLFGWIALAVGWRGTAIAWLVAEVVGMVVTGLAMFFLLAGIVDVTTLDPRLSLTEQPAVLRHIARSAAIAALATAAVRYTAMLFSSWGRAVPTLLIEVSTWLFAIALAATWTLACRYVAELARRIPELELAGRIKVHANGFAICCAIGIVVALAQAILSRATAIPDPWASWIAGACSVAGIALGAVGLVFLVSLASLWSKHLTALRRCRDEAQRASE